MYNKDIATMIKIGQFELFMTKLFMKKLPVGI
jgi:hypothetical protein